MSMTNEQLAEVLKGINQKEDKTQKFSQNNTYVSIGVLLVILYGANYITQSLSKMETAIAELKIEMRTYGSGLDKHESLNYHDGMRPFVDTNYVSIDKFNSLSTDVFELKNDTSTIKATQQEILLELRSNGAVR